MARSGFSSRAPLHIGRVSCPCHPSYHFFSFFYLTFLETINSALNPFSTPWKIILLASLSHYIQTPGLLPGKTRVPTSWLNHEKERKIEEGLEIDWYFFIIIVHLSFLVNCYKETNCSKNWDEYVSINVLCIKDTRQRSKYLFKPTERGWKFLKENRIPNM